MYPKLLIIIRNNQFCVQDTTFSQFRFKKGQKTKFYDPEIVTANNKIAIGTSLWVQEGSPLFSGESQIFSAQLDHKNIKDAKIAIFVPGGL